jgi:rhodanese-related sulfurtransferase
VTVKTREVRQANILVFIKRTPGRILNHNTSPPLKNEAICANQQCNASKEAAEKLSKMGFNVATYRGGLEEWRKSNFPTDVEHKAA